MASALVGRVGSGALPEHLATAWGPGTCKPGGGRLHFRLGWRARQRAAGAANRRRCMRFVLVDQISELVPGQRIRAVKALSLAEEYLADHFPRFPIMPGVLMIEALAQASAWLVRVTEDFAHSMHLLSEARNVTYKSIVSPGQVFEMLVEAKEIGERSSRFVGVGRCGNAEMVKAHWSLRHFNLADENPVMESLDRRLIASARQQLALLRRG